MFEMTGNIFDLAFNSPGPNILLIMTNGCWTSKGDAVMGRGIAKAAKELFPDCSKTLGTFLRLHYEHFKDYPGSEEGEPWNVPYKIGMHGDTHVFSFPTKPTKVTVTKTSILPRFFSERQMGMRIDGWKGFSLLPLIERSAKFIASLVGEKPSFLERVFLPRVGTLNGGLEWDDVREVLEKYFNDDRYIVVERG